MCKPVFLDICNDNSLWKHSEIVDQAELDSPGHSQSQDDEMNMGLWALICLAGHHHRVTGQILD